MTKRKFRYLKAGEIIKKGDQLKYGEYWYHAVSGEIGGEIGTCVYDYEAEAKLARRRKHVRIHNDD